MYGEQGRLPYTRCDGLRRVLSLFRKTNAYTRVVNAEVFLWDL